MRGADLTGAKLDGADLRHADLASARLVGAQAIGTDYPVHDFSGWRYELSEVSVQNLLEDLRADAKPKGLQESNSF